MKKRNVDFGDRNADWLKRIGNHQVEDLRAIEDAKKKRANDERKRQIKRLRGEDVLDNG